TGHTTAKLTAQHGLIYDELIANVGKSKAKLYYEAQNEALEFVRKTVEEQSIECDLSPQTAYMYATTNEYAHNIQKEAEAYKQLGINGAITEDIPLEIEMKNAVTMEGQAQFHPLKYLTHLVKEMEEMGVHIYENSTAVNIKKEAKHQVLTKED